MRPEGEEKKKGSGYGVGTRGGSGAEEVEVSWLDEQHPIFLYDTSSGCLKMCRTNKTNGKAGDLGNFVFRIRIPGIFSRRPKHDFAHPSRPLKAASARQAPMTDLFKGE